MHWHLDHLQRDGDETLLSTEMFQGRVEWSHGTQ